MKLSHEYSKRFEKLINFVEDHDFKGWDPYDGLNSPFFNAFPLKHSKIFRLAWIQFFKQCPLNLRKLFLINKEYNSKAIALFLTGYCNLYKLTKRLDYQKQIKYLSSILIRLVNNKYSGPCWGYNFPWQNRNSYLPKNFPTVVTTSFVSYALMDSFDCTGNTVYLKTALNSCNFILKDLIKTEYKNGFLFSYTPLSQSCVYNASLLASRLLARAYYYCNNIELLENSKASILACVEAQNDKGAWPYGSLPYQNWVDSFHTGYNLECISEYQRFSNDKSFKNSLQKGLKYYLLNFFMEDGTPKYYDNSVYPIDIHSPAQFIVTIIRMKKYIEHKTLVEKVLKWTFDNMQDKDTGYFYYQKRSLYNCRIPYMRWGQAWMFYAISFYLSDF